MTYLVIVLIPKSSYFQNILVMLTALTWGRHNETIELFLAKYLCELLKCTKNNGFTVIGYNALSIMDNFELNSVYT